MIETHITLENETLSSFLHRITGNITSELLADTLKRNPQLTAATLRYPYGTEITINVPETTTQTRTVETLW